MIFFLLIFLLFLGCRNNNENYIDSYILPKQVVFDNENYDDLPFKWSAPSYWLDNKKTNMRVGSYLIPSSNGSADLSITYLNGDGGGITANVNRWRNQLNLSSLSQEEVQSSAQIFSGYLGEYKLYEIINDDNKESAFLCAIIPSNLNNDFTIFVKLNAYSDNINDLKEEFISFVSSFQYNE